MKVQACIGPAPARATTFWRAVSGRHPLPRISTPSLSPRLRVLACAPLAITLVACGGDDDEPRTAVPATAVSATACDAAALSAALPAGTAITSAVAASAPVANCRVRGTITSTAPANVVNFSLTLPDSYSGRYIYEAPGGAAGNVGNPQASLLERGYAVATSDHGTRPASTFNYAWRADPGQLLDYNLRAVHNTTRLAHALTQAYYRGPRPVSYMIGCSAGGRHVRNHARNYGTELFDGFMGSAPPSTASNTIMHTRIAQYMARQPSSWISPELALAGEQLIIATYDSADRVVDGIIQDERLFNFDSAILASAGFTPEQIALVDFIRASYPHLDTPAPTVNGGKTPGFPITRLREWTNWILGSRPPPWVIGQPGIPNGFSGGGSTLAAIYGDGYDWVNNYDFSNPADFRRWTAAVGDNAGAAGYDYTRLVRGGGKAIFYVGMGDAAQSFKETLVTRQQMAVHTPDVDAYSKVYFVPGWGHCGPSGAGGAAAVEVQNKLLDALIGWVEHGTPAGPVEAVRTATATAPERTFVLCPEPQIAVYAGGGADFNSASSWRCQRANLPQLFP